MRWVAAILALALAGCTTLGVDTAPSAKEKQALAPTGKLRVGLVQGDLRGVGYELGRELARRIGVAFEPVLYPSAGAVLEGAKAREWDVSFNGVTPELAQYLDFTAAHLEIEFGYLVPPGSPLASGPEVDRPGIRVAVPQNGSVDVFLSRTLKNASVVRAAGLPGVLEMVRTGRADVAATHKPDLFEAEKQLPGARILEGSPGGERQAMVIPKGRDAGLAYARRFVEDAKYDGFVQAALERAGLRGATVPLAEPRR